MSESFPIVSGSKVLRALKGDFDRLPTQDPGSDGGSYYSPETVYRNFLAMSVAFSMNHACVVTCLAYASAELGDYIGSISSGVLYITFAVTAFLLSKPVVSALGSKRALLIGVSGYCIYVAGFLLALVFDSMVVWLAWTVMCISAAVGGAAGGLLWTAQGRYFSLHAKLYSEALGVPAERANSTFAGLFAMVFLGTETLTKLLATVIFLLVPGGAPYIIFSLYTLIAIASCVVVSVLDDLDDHGVMDLTYTTVSNHAGSAARMVYNDKRMVLIIPFQLVCAHTRTSLIHSFIHSFTLLLACFDRPSDSRRRSCPTMCSERSSRTPRRWARHTWACCPLSLCSSARPSRCPRRTQPTSMDHT